MKHVVAITMLTVVLLGSNAWAEGFRIEIAHFDGLGALTASPDDPTPLADGCVGQVIEDVNDDGLVPPRNDGTPGEGDRLFKAAAYGKQNRSNFFAVNGTSYFGSAGYFFRDSVLMGTTLPAHRVAIRVFNASDPAIATGCWDTPLYSVLAGFQQVSFLRGEWTYHPLSPAGTDRNATALAVNGNLLAAYPNPFNSSTRLSFALSREQFVKLKIYDVQGRTVSQLLDGPQSAGQHDLEFNASALPSGLYFVSLYTGGDIAAVKKLLLVR